MPGLYKLEMFQEMIKVYLRYMLPCVRTFLCWFAEKEHKFLFGLWFWAFNVEKQHTVKHSFLADILTILDTIGGINQKA